jgi:hypothetical protein
VQRPITVTGGNVVVDVAVSVVVVDAEGAVGSGAPVENRQPAPGGLNAAILTIGGGRFVDGPMGAVVVGEVDVVGPVVVVGPAPVDVVVECCVVVGSAAVER